MTRRLAAGLLVAASVAAPVAAQGLRVAWAPALEHLQLTERAVDGRRLVREAGPLAGLRVDAERPVDGGGAWRFAAAVAAGRTDYDGRTQSGAPATSHTRSQIFSAEVRRAWPAGAGWSAEAGVAGEWFRRRIEPSGAAAGLDERLVQPRLLAGLAWSGGAWSARATLGQGLRAPLVVRFDGGAFKRTTLRSGRADLVGLEAGVALAPGWRLHGGGEWLAVGRSRERVLRSEGAAVGRVAQPEWSRTRLWIAAAWSPGG